MCPQQYFQSRRLIRLFTKETQHSQNASKWSVEILIIIIAREIGNSILEE